MRKNPERLAWIVLLASFFTCIGLVVAVPLSVRAYILFAQEGQNVILEVQKGPLRVTWAGRGEPIAIAEKRDGIPDGTVVATDSTAGRLVMHAPQDDAPVVASVQLYNNTEIMLSSALSPRFSISLLPHQVTMEIKAGRARITVSDTESRPTVAEVHTPYGIATLTEGSYEVKVNAKSTEVTVRHGQADIENGGLTTHLEPAERAIASDEHITSPLPATRNLIVNGDFQVALEGWNRESEQTDPEQPEGRVEVITHEGREVAHFYRTGSNHAQIGIRQEVNYDVRDFTSLELNLAVRVIHEDIAGFGGCGYLGSECPIIVRIDYKDVYDTDREWLHGFYIGEPAGDWLINWWAEPVQPESWQTYGSDNLMEELVDTPPAFIKSLTIYASGHSFQAMVTEVELLAQE